MARPDSKEDKAYRDYLEKVMKFKYPYEYALLKSDLKENLKRLPVVKDQEPYQTYHVASKYFRDHIRYWR